MGRSDVEAVKARLSRIRHKVDRLSGDRWGHELSDKGDRIVIMRAVFDTTGKKVGFDAPITLCSFGPDVTTFEKELVRDAVEDLAFVLEQLSNAGQMIRELRGASRGGRSTSQPATVDGDGGDASREAAKPNYAAEAAMKCNEASFQTYLRERHGSDDDGDLSDSANAAAVQRRALKIGARGELNTDPDAAARWRDMRADFQAWERGDET